jgi:hypothetical protein
VILTGGAEITTLWTLQLRRSQRLFNGRIESQEREERRIEENRREGRRIE